MDASDSPKTAVVVADDQQDMLHSISNILEKAGFVILAGSDGSSVLNRCRESRCPVDLAVIDTAAPGMETAEIAQRLHEISARVRMLFLSEPGTRVTESTARGHVHQVLRKPFRRAQLLGKVLEIMDEPITMTA
jgi:response regulator RpfG family c-di-GMP phosphodiesterase